MGRVARFDDDRSEVSSQGGGQGVDWWRGKRGQGVFEEIMSGSPHPLPLNNLQASPPLSSHPADPGGGQGRDGAAAIDNDSQQPDKRMAPEGAIPNRAVVGINPSLSLPSFPSGRTQSISANYHRRTRRSIHPVPMVWHAGREMPERDNVVDMTCCDLDARPSDSPFVQSRDHTNGELQLSTKKERGISAPFDLLPWRDGATITTPTTLPARPTRHPPPSR